MPTEWLWTWGGECFGYRRGEWLFTYDGRTVGRFVGDEVYATSGNYLGELRSAGQERRLTTSNYKKSRVVEAFSPKVEEPYERRANRLPQTVYCGYQDFPSPEIFKAEVSKALRSRTEILSTPPSPRPNRHTGTTAVATLPQQVPQMERAVSVDANALARLFGTAEPYDGTYEHAASSESNSILTTSNLTQLIATPGKSGDEAAPPQADQRAENLRQVLLNIKSRRARA